MQSCSRTDRDAGLEIAASSDACVIADLRTFSNRYVMPCLNAISDAYTEIEN